MSTWAIGDLQGCAEAFDRLLAAIDFRRGRDRLWFVGDLVNRGPDSLGALRRVIALGDDAATVLGNHDLHLLARLHGYGQRKSRDTLEDILDAPDADALRRWLLERPLAIIEGHRVLVHAGVSPAWTLELLREQACLTAQWMRQDPCDFFARMYGNTPQRWTDARDAESRARYTVNTLTRMRYVYPDTSLDFDCKSAPGSQPPPLMPWFAHPGRQLGDVEVFFGHWSTLGRVAWPEYRVWGLDTGCVWGGKLTAVDVETKRIVSVPARPAG